MPLTHKIHVRCYGELGDFLKPSQRGRRFVYIIKGCPSIKDTIEAIGVPHVEVDAILVNGQGRDFRYQLKEGDDIKAYPAGRHFDKGVAHLAKSPPKLHFVADSHLGKLARDLRLLGFSVIYRTFFPDELIVGLASRQRRIVLSRDKGLLKHKSLHWGYWVRSFEHQRQLKEVVTRYCLLKFIRPFSRCVACNGLIKKTAKHKVLEELAPKTKLYYQDFYRCQKCRKIYWPGSHYQKMTRFIRTALRRKI